MLTHTIDDEIKRRRREYIEEITPDLGLRALMLDFYEAENGVGVKRDQFYRILHELPTLYRKSFLNNTPIELLQSIHSTVAYFKKTLLAIMIEAHQDFLDEFPSRHLQKVFTVKRVESTLEDLDLRRGAQEPLSAAIAYHTERQLLYCLACAYNYAVIDEYDALSNAANTFCRLLQTNEDPFDGSQFSKVRQDGSKKLLHMLKRYECLYKERYRNFQVIPGQVHFVFDLDETLITDLLSRQCDDLVMHWFKENNLVDEFFNPYLIHPGAIELLRFLFGDPSIRVSFYSAGVDARNEGIVDTLLMRAVGAERFKKVKEAVTVFSRCDLDEGYAPPELFSIDFRYGARIKNLRRITAPEKIEDTILIDDTTSVCCPGQERNMLVHHFDGDRNFHLEGLHEANHVFYIASVIKWLLANRDKQSLAETLLRFQYAASGARSATIYPYSSRFYSKQANNSYYRSGLALLRTLNEKLNFFGGSAAKSLETDFSLAVYKRDASPHVVATDLFAQLSAPVKLNIFTFFDAQSRAVAPAVSSDWKVRCRKLPAPRMG